MQLFFAYIRVSTQKQGQLGVSLQEQRAAIERYAQRQKLTIARWFEERETAAKRGRPVFTQMLKELRGGRAKGLVVHKIDRSARNLKDWADLGELIDTGVEVHFATESLDLHTRGGRLSADIQAVVAADFIRNLREETRKGFYGRLNQGVYPLRAPVGYLDCGSGKPKEPDPATAPLVRTAFELYANGTHTLQTLRAEMTRRGLRNRNGGTTSMNGLSTILNNPFYIGLMRIRRTNQTFKGAHTPIISVSTFNRVQAVLSGKLSARVQRHSFLYRRLLRCARCGYSLIGERQKGHAYYRCHTQKCPKTSIREEAVEQALLEVFWQAQLPQQEVAALRLELARVVADGKNDREARLRGLDLQLTQLRSRQDRLVDAYVDKVIDQGTFEQRKARLLSDQAALQEQLDALRSGRDRSAERVGRILELAETLHSGYISAPELGKRELLAEVTSNRVLAGKTLMFELKSPFAEIANLAKSTRCDLQRDGPRTLALQITEWAELQAALAKEREQTTAIGASCIHANDNYAAEREAA